MILHLTWMAILPVVASIFCYQVKKRAALGNLKSWIPDIGIGLIFGLLAILSTEFGIETTNGVTINTRNATVLSAGLIFGPWSGIAAGLVSGAERYLSVLWGGGAYTQLASSLATVLTGFIGAGLRKFMFSDKQLAPLYALALGLTAEVLHMSLIFFTNMSDLEKAFRVVNGFARLMILLNGISVMLAVFSVILVNRKKKTERTEIKPIIAVFLRWLLLCVVLAFLYTSLFTAVLQSKIAENNALSMLQLNIQDVVEDISDASDRNLLELTRQVAQELKNNRDLPALMEQYGVAEINLIDKNGIVADSTNEELLNYNMAGATQSAAFLPLLRGQKELVQRYQPTGYNLMVYRKYAAVSLPEGGFVQVGYDTDQIQKNVDTMVQGVTKNRHVGTGGCVIIADKEFKLVSDPHNFEGYSLYLTGIWIDELTMAEGEYYSAEVYGEESYWMYDTSEGYYIISILPVEEVEFSRNLAVYTALFTEVLVFGMLLILIYILVKKLVVDNIQRINESLAQITGGNLDVVVNVRSNEEFAFLSDDINSTVVTLKRYIAEAEARIDEELQFAQAIQHSSLPAVFPPFPGRKEFAIFASMDTAKEVGGDFYDFYFVEKNKLAFLIADVSGKGIPAAMFMMRAKTEIKSQAESGKEVDEILTEANERLCENNDAAMFVTAWMGIIDLQTGLITYANAGHNPPLVRHGDGSFEYLKGRPGFVLAGMEGLVYRKNTIQMKPGDKIYLYTDGVTEATDANSELYSEKRLVDFLNVHPDLPVEETCAAVKADVDAFVGEAPQFDDITMLCLQYFGEENSES